ncbi:hypothetical protein LTR37_001056 [Vermiconidia calcicola]|uniref:Uncharacterized protein n=1 Tax=Vermiconidia calcicola TaxID=1690605 RepID=A0ACC3NYF5_9PEZI|nr:hypothetical protein LTR37_001056 [Vermiconidia calcicola]
MDDMWMSLLLLMSDLLFVAVVSRLPLGLLIDLQSALADPANKTQVLADIYTIHVYVLQVVVVAAILLGVHFAAIVRMTGALGIPSTASPLEPQQRQPADQHAPASKFLALPGELRNTIYRYALLSDPGVLVMRQQFSEPALLATCRQVRDEAVSVYFENKFQLECTDWNPDVLIAFNSRVGRLKLGTTVKSQTCIYSEGAIKKRTLLLDFLKAQHAGRHSGFTYSPVKDPVDPVTNAGVGGCEIVRRLQGRPWDEVDGVLQVYLDDAARGSGQGWQWE